MVVFSFHLVLISSLLRRCAWAYFSSSPSLRHISDLGFFVSLSLSLSLSTRRQLFRVISGYSLTWTARNWRSRKLPFMIAKFASGEPMRSEGNKISVTVPLWMHVSLLFLFHKIYMFYLWIHCRLSKSHVLVSGLTGTAIEVVFSFYKKI